jgi:drug/metabolite transporter (DMT)-like permease
VDKTKLIGTAASVVGVGTMLVTDSMTGQLLSGLESMGVMAAFGGAVVAAGGVESVRGLRGMRAAGAGGTAVRAAAFAGVAGTVAVVGAILVRSLEGRSAGPYEWVAAVLAAAFAGGAIVSRRSG